jgi:hypothetical protein
VARRFAAIPLVVVLVATAALVAHAMRDRPAELTRAQLTSYQAAIVGPLRDGGAIIQKGMKPGVADLASRHVVPPAAIVGEAQAWVAALTRVRSKLAVVAPPPQLRKASQLFDQALVGYLQAAMLFGQAAGANGDQRKALLTRGYATAEAADRTYDQASRILQRSRRHLGLGPTVDFPDPDTRQS